jgi:hypothetical protein
MFMVCFQTLRVPQMPNPPLLTAPLDEPFPLDMGCIARFGGRRFPARSGTPAMRNFVLSPERIPALPSRAVRPSGYVGRPGPTPLDEPSPLDMGFILHFWRSRDFPAESGAARHA